MLVADAAGFDAVERAMMVGSLADVIAGLLNAGCGARAEAATVRPPAPKE